MTSNRPSPAGDARPLISVITMVYNREDTLRRAMDSVLAQTYDKFEYIIVDDGSTDGTRAIIEEYIRRDSRVRAIHQPNGGVGHARNVGLAQARGDYVAWVDSDDEAMPDFLELLLDACLRSGRKLAMCNYLNLRQGAAPHPRFPWCTEDKEYPGDVLLPLVLSSTISSSMSKNLMARELYRGLRFPENALFEDTLISPVLYARVDGAVLLAKPLFNRFIHPGNISSNRSLDTRFDTCQDLMILCNYVREHLPHCYSLVFMRSFLALNTLRSTLLRRRFDGFRENRGRLREILEFYRREGKPILRRQRCLLLRLEYAVYMGGTRGAMALSKAIGMLADALGHRPSMKHPPVRQFLPDYVNGFTWTGGDGT